MAHEGFVGYNQAKKLKDLGYDWKGFWFYLNNGLLSSEHIDIPSYANWRNYNDPEEIKYFNAECVECSAPTLAEAQRWLREEKDTEIIVNRVDKGVYGCTIYGKLVDLVSTDRYHTYEDALSKGIDRVLELLKQK